MLEIEAPNEIPGFKKKNVSLCVTFLAWRPFTLKDLATVIIAGLYIKEKMWGLKVSKKWQWMKERENLCKQVLHNLYKKTNGFKGSMKCAQEIFSDEFFFSDGISGAYEWPIKQAWAPPENKHRKSAEW